MKKFLIGYLLILILAAVAGMLWLKGTGWLSQIAQVSEVFEAQEKIIREPSVAGQFYPASESELRNQINQFLEKAELTESEGEILALILPHAGYQYSGQVAAAGFKKLIGEDVETVILLGNSHHERFEGISVYPKGFYQTPLGEVEIDSLLAEKIMEDSERIFFRETAHKNEHSLEVQIPFLQVVIERFTLPNFSTKNLGGLKIVPIVFGNSSGEDHRILAQAILKHIKGKNVLLIASSDLSHYPAYEQANYADSKTIEAILKGEAEELEKTIQDLEKEKIPNAVTFACGEDAIKTVMLVAKELGAHEIKLLDSANSGDLPAGRHGVSGDKTRVVGYVSIGFFGQRRGNLLNKAEQKKILEIAKTSVESFVGQGKTPEFNIEELMLNQKLGAFVTLKEHDQLRGCIGRFSPTDIPLYQVVSQMAIAAATKDQRFFPVTSSELEELEYEISVLSPLEKINDWGEIMIGRHGVQIRQGLKSGVFLPQVATENNWDLEKFLGELCSQKVGLSRDCWKSKDIELYIFTAQVF